MSEKNAVCAVCERDVQMWWWQDHHGQEVRCDYCGYYRIGDRTYAWMREHAAKPDPLLRYLSAYIRQAPSPPSITLDSWREFAKSIAERTTEQRADKILDLLRDRSTFHGKSVPFEPDDKPLVDVAHDEEADYVLRLLMQRGLIESHSNGYVVTPQGWVTRVVASPKPNRVFLSHAAADAPLAQKLADAIRQRLPDSDVFVSSQPGQIATGEKWLEAIEEKLQSGDTFVILLTEASIGRPWVWFETGSVWFSGKRILPVAAGLSLGEIPHPLSVRQAQTLDDPARLKQFFEDLSIKLTDSEAEQLFAVLREASSKVTTQATAPWTGTHFEGQSYVWNGPLHGLQDWTATTATKTLMAFVESQGFTSRCGRKERLAHHLQNGYAQVFVSDLKTYKRALTCPDASDQLWLIRPVAVSES